MNTLAEVIEAQWFVSWVRSLPGEWTTPVERLVLFMIAVQGGEHHGSREDLARAVGVRTAVVAEVVQALGRPTTIRPALLSIITEDCTALELGDECRHAPAGALALCATVSPAAAPSP